jgi:hypothetical protein
MKTRRLEPHEFQTAFNVRLRQLKKDRGIPISPYGERGLGPGTEEATLRPRIAGLLNKENKWPSRLKT